MSTKKFAALLIILSFIYSLPAFSDENDFIRIEPPSPEYLKWLESPDLFKGGLIPSPIDNSDLWKDPPRPREKFSVKDTFTIPAKYDLRDYNRIPAIKNQNPWGTCWVFASIASIESTFMTLYPDKQDIDLSEMFTAYFAYGDTRAGKSYCKSKKNEDILSQGGKYYRSIALLARLGTVNEKYITLSDW